MIIAVVKNYSFVSRLRSVQSRDNTVLSFSHICGEQYTINVRRHSLLNGLRWLQ